MEVLSQDEIDLLLIAIGTGDPVSSVETPKNEVQFLCRVQTIDAVEKFSSQKREKTLFKKTVKKQ